MSEVYESIDEELAGFIASQHVFFVATAPTEGGHVNLSPKGLDTFRILGPNRVAYLDLTGSGVETIAHLSQNGRITFMFCAFDGPPAIVRLYGTGRALRLGSDEYEELAASFPEQPGARAVIVADIDRIADSCGYAVPKLTFAEERNVLTRWAARQTDAELADYRQHRNAESIDGLPGLTST
ncbi:MAG: pyridoxamine 5'-phosphate oxidase family protein [Ilumatobacteraceae bacterium]